MHWSRFRTIGTRTFLADRSAIQPLTDARIAHSTRLQRVEHANALPDIFGQNSRIFGHGLILSQYFNLTLAAGSLWSIGCVHGRPSQSLHTINLLDRLLLVLPSGVPRSVDSLPRGVGFHRHRSISAEQGERQQLRDRDSEW